MTVFCGFREVRATLLPIFLGRPSRPPQKKILLGFLFRVLCLELQPFLSPSAPAVQFLLPFDLLVLAHDTSLKVCKYGNRGFSPIHLPPHVSGVDGFHRVDTLRPEQGGVNPRHNPGGVGGDESEQNPRDGNGGRIA